MQELNSVEKNPAAPKSTLELQVLELVSYHKPTDKQVEQINVIREATEVMLLAIATNCPPGPDKSAAIRKARETMMTANASIVVPFQSL